MSSLSCHHCGSSEIDRDPARGDAVCTGCGSVLEDNIIVSEIQFEENRLGGTSAVGQFVSADGRIPALSGGAFHHGLGRQSRDITLQKARKAISQLGQQLFLTSSQIDIAVRFFQMAVQKRLTRGRKQAHVIGACIYMVCRKANTAHMLLDVSDIVQVNVYTLGKTFVHLCQALNITLHSVDPSIYILRFAHKLEFGKKTMDVFNTATRLVNRMKSDWIHTGRRPSGLCGAALLVASRLHEFNRTTKDIIKVVKVCETTLKKRLNEFGETPSSHLTFDEFKSIDLEEKEDPPAFKVARKNAKNRQPDDQIDTEEATKEITKLQKEIEKALDEHRHKMQKRYAKYLQPSEEIVEEEIVTEETQVESIIADETLDAIQKVLNETGESHKLHESVTVVQSSTCKQLKEPPCKKMKCEEISNGLGPTTESLGLKESIEECMKVNPANEEIEESGELDLSGIDDQEIEYYIMTDNEVKRKTELWNKINAEYIEEQKVKEEREAKDKEEGIVKPEKKRRKITKRKSNAPANTAGEAIEKMLQEKRISNKINYEVLRNLNNEQTDKQETAPKMPSSLEASSSWTQPGKNIPEGSLASRLASAFLGSPAKSFQNREIETKLKRLPSILSKNRTLMKSTTATVDTEQNTEEQKVQVAHPSEPDVILETGPVQYDSNEEAEDEDDLGETNLYQQDDYEYFSDADDS